MITTAARRIARTLNSYPTEACRARSIAFDDDGRELLVRMYQNLAPWPADVREQALLTLDTTSRWTQREVQLRLDVALTCRAAGQPGMTDALRDAWEIDDSRGRPRTPVAELIDILREAELIISGGEH